MSKKAISEEQRKRLCALRKLLVEPDHALLASYGWVHSTDSNPAPNPEYVFHEVDYLPANGCLRYTIHPDGRRKFMKGLAHPKLKVCDEEEAKGSHRPQP